MDKTFDETQEKLIKQKDSAANILNSDTMLRNRSENIQKQQDPMEESFLSFAMLKQSEANGTIKKTFETYSKNSSINNIKQLKNSVLEDYNTFNTRSQHSPKSNTMNEVNINGKQSIEKKDSNRIITDTDIIASPYLKIEEVYGDILRNQKLKINAGGLTTSTRKARDGVTFFGKSNKNVNNSMINAIRA
jgi:hypothetical protein